MQAIEPAYAHLSSTLFNRSYPSKLKTLRNRSAFWRLNLPYQLLEFAPGRFILLNREYKPLGYPKGVYVDYPKHPAAFRCSAASIAHLKETGVIDAAGYLYSDGSSPGIGRKETDALLVKVAELSKLMVRPIVEVLQ